MNNIFLTILILLLLMVLVLSSTSKSTPTPSLPSTTSSLVSPTIIEIENNIKMIKSNITAAVEAQDYQLAASLKTLLIDAQDKLSKALKFQAAIGNEFPIPNDLYNKSYHIYNEKIKNFEVKYSNDINMFLV